ncbi:UPF0489 family protein [Dehalogenimonas etheniformans]|uniref:Uncharacterized protein n=1 Tax=Dehalogenimonas etheniformans TaxID=1536648 RepID=A0A2P5P4S7_9CHLR|nr:UPF0489 family protein [Dehalogenimonas etheniformans]PPD57298.1 hypothetical protein JP09_009625 [Dehalogenimonas etheniformans]QNT77013.1 UPF0489 family protein [Dehalogenimonas etheniformans]
MRCLDIDLDFFLNRDAYYSGDDALRLGENYRPWQPRRVRSFLENNCGLSLEVPVIGRVIESHDLVLRFWQELIDSGYLRVPFDVIHVDAHPDLSIRGGIYLVEGRLYVDPVQSPAVFEDDYVHSGNYLSYAIAMGWVASLTWVPLHEPPMRSKSGAQGVEKGQPGIVQRDWGPGCPFEVLSRHHFQTRQPFDCLILSKSPAFTPVASDALIPLISSYMKMV